MSSEISWFTLPVGAGVGYGYAAVCLIKALQAKEVKVSYDTTTPRVHISFIQPEFYSGIPDQYRIGYTPWESTALPIAWPRMMKEMDEIWTTSKFCQDVYEAHDIKSTVVPHGIDPDAFPIFERTISEKFIFFHIGGPTERKGGQKVVDAFLKLFDNNDYPDAYLLMKSNGPSEARWYSGNTYMGNVSSHPKIQVFEAELSETDLTRLYEVSHCMVYPTNGEGFGFIPFQAIATGMPTICTNATGCADFAEYSVPLNDYKWAEGEGVHLGEWVEPSFDELCEKMMYVYENWEDEKKKAVHSARIIHETQNWSVIADQVLQLLGDKINEVVG